MMKETNHFPVYVVFDLETNSKFPPMEIIEIGAVKIKNGQIIDEFQMLINISSIINYDIVFLTGITPHMLSQAPKITQVLPLFVDFIQDSVLVAHNASFDYRLLKQSLLQHDLLTPQLNNQLKAMLCTLFLGNKYRKQFNQPGNLKLEQLAIHFDIILTDSEFQPHRALYDAQVTAHLLLKLCQHLSTKQSSIILPDSKSFYRRELDLRPFQQI